MPPMVAPNNSLKPFHPIKICPNLYGAHDVWLWYLKTNGWCRDWVTKEGAKALFCLSVDQTVGRFLSRP